MNKIIFHTSQNCPSFIKNEPAQNKNLYSANYSYDTSIKTNVTLIDKPYY